MIVETTGANAVLFSGVMGMTGVIGDGTGARELLLLRVEVGGGATKDEDKEEEKQGEEEEGAAESKGAVVARVIG